MESPRLLCTFRLGDLLFGVDTLDVKEVTNENKWTHIPHAPQEVLGLVNIRGHIHLALDLRRLLGMPGEINRDDCRLILFKTHVGSAFGVVVDEISEIRTVSSEQLEPFISIQRESIPSNLRRVDLVSALCKQFGELIVVLNPRRFLTIVEQGLVQSA